MIDTTPEKCDLPFHNDLNINNCCYRNISTQFLDYFLVIHYENKEVFPEHWAMEYNSILLVFISFTKP